jgi:DNA-binding transcriptional ArsR family regulator
MLKQSVDLDAAFQALADPTRRAMVEHLATGPRSVSDLARPFAVTLAAIMQHLKVLESSGLVASEKTGRVRTVRLNAEALTNAEQWMAARRRTWETRLDVLAQLIETEAPTEGTPS